MNNFLSLEGGLQKILFDPTVGKIILTVIGLIIIFVISKVVGGNVGKFVKEGNNRYYIKKVVNFIAFLIAILFLSTVFSDKFSSLSVAIGVAGAGIAFALQEVIASVAGWMAILFGGFYSTGDRVQVGGSKGDVIDIGVLRTTLMELGQWVNGDLYTGRIIRVANSFVFKEPVFNYSADFPFLWDELVVPIKWGSDLAKTAEMFESITEDLVGDFTDGSKKAWAKVVNKFRIEDAKLDPIITYAFTPGQVDYTIRYIVDYKMRRTVKYQLSQKLIAAIEAEKSTEIASASEYQLTHVADMSVRMSPS